MGNTRRLNVTSISEVIYCNLDYYNDHVNDELSEFRLFIVESPGNSTLEVYYGSRKLRDTIVAKSYPSGRDYPSDKLYIRFDSSNNLRNLLYKRSNGEIVDLVKYLPIKEVRLDHSSFEVVWNTNDLTKLIVLSTDGSSSEFTDLVIDQLSEDLVEEFSVKWETFS